MIGVFLDNYGGDIEYLLGIKVIVYMLEWKHLRKKVGYKIMMF